MAIVDLKPAATRLSALVAAIPDRALGNPTPFRSIRIRSASRRSMSSLQRHLPGRTVTPCAARHSGRRWRSTTGHRYSSGRSRSSAATLTGGRDGSSGDFCI